MTIPVLQLVTLDENGQPWQTIRYPYGGNTWQQEYLQLTTVSALPSGRTLKTVASGSSDGANMQVVGVDNTGKILHTIRSASGTWQSSFGDVGSVVSGSPSTGFKNVACAGELHILHVLGLGVDGKLYYTNRFRLLTSSVWQSPFTSITSTGGPSQFAWVGCAVVDSGVLQVVGIGTDGSMWHTRRSGDGTWNSAWGNVRGQTSDGPTTFTQVSCAGAEDRLYVVALGNDGLPYLTYRMDDGSWRSSFLKLTLQSSGGPSTYTAVSCGSPDGQTLVVTAIGEDKTVWYTVRAADESWQSQFLEVSDFSHDGPTQTVALGSGPGGDARIKHIFLLMLENRSFDHMLGFSGLTGTEALTGEATEIVGLSGTESNSYGGQTYTVHKGADYEAKLDPGHEFNNVLKQLCGSGASYSSGGNYPTRNLSGFVSDYVSSGGSSDPGVIMDCFDSANQLPVLTSLAKEFAVCDGWFSSMPGPTWPNRFFSLAASSGGLDDSPTEDEMAWWMSVDGFEFQHGTLFDSLEKKGLNWRIYRGGDLFIASALKGIYATSAYEYEDFEDDVASSYPASFTLIEPDYGAVYSDYTGGNSQHPLDDVRPGESLIKATYEALRNSPIWNSSMLIVTWDEHGGFYDHVAPGTAPAPDDTPKQSGVSRHGFTFKVYGSRVPAVIISPWVNKGTIDHRTYDHASIPATCNAAFGMSSLTNRDKVALDTMSLATRATPRTDCPDTLSSSASTPSPVAPRTLTDDGEPLDGGALPGWIILTARAVLQLHPERKEELLARVQGLKTRGEARALLQELMPLIRGARKRAR